MQFQLLLFILFICIAGCGDNNNESRIFTEQEAALNKAKEVEDKILDAAEAQRQIINENTDDQ